MSENKDGYRVFTLDELGNYDGKDGKPLYLIFKGKVYNLSENKLWVNAKHMGLRVFHEKPEETIKQASHAEEVLPRSMLWMAKKAVIAFGEGRIAQ
jgi:predicted heme/steroid binding protein